MGHTFYDGTIAVVQAILTSLSHILHQAEQRPNAGSLLDARLHEDMYPLADQIRITTQWSANLVARLTGAEPVMFEGKPTTFAQCYERIQAVLTVLNGADRSVVNHHADVLASTQIAPAIMADVSGAMYAHAIVLPNVFFHLATAYGILRKEGVPLGKRDYCAGFSGQLAGVL